MPFLVFVIRALVACFLQEGGDEGAEAEHTGGGESDTAGGRVSRAGRLSGTAATGAGARGG